MKKVFRITVVLLVLISLFVSCKKEDLDIYQTLIQPYVRSNEEMGLALFFRTSVKEGERVTLYVTDPSGKLSWTLDAIEAEFEDVKYIGSADIAMPQGSVLPKGTWNVDLIFKDGRKVSQLFEVDYRDNFPTEPGYDAESNLTLVQ